MAQVIPLKYMTIPSTQRHTATVIFVHGMGDTGRGFLPVTDALKTDPGLGHVKWILPDSPRRPVKANADMITPSWSNVDNFGFDGKEDEKGIKETSLQLNALITEELNKGTDASRVIIGGFSQGGAMSLLTGLTCPNKLGGIVVLSGWLPLKKKIKNMMSPHATSLPLFWGHGRADIIVPYEQCKTSVGILRECGISSTRDNEINGIKWRAYEGMAHVTDPQELEDLKAWLKAVIPKDK